MTPGRIGALILRFVVPATVLVLALGYLGMATLGGVNPPVVPISGDSMGPTLRGGDLAVLQRAGQLRKGEVVAISVPASRQRKYGLPAGYVHRIVKVGHDSKGIVLTTRGDANYAFDAFHARPKDVVGELWFNAPGLGRPVLFLRSLQGQIFLGAAVLLALLYLTLGLAERRRRRPVEEGTTVTVQALLAEAQALRARASAPLDGSAPEPLDDELFDEMREASERSRETAETMRELVGAIGEYGEHLRSHTAVMQSLAGATAELHRATSELRLARSADDDPSPSSSTASLPLEPLRRRLEERTAAVDALLAELDRVLDAATWPALATAGE